MSVTPLYLLGSPRPVRAMTQSDVKFVFGTFTFSAAYPSGGESLSPSDVGLEEIFFFLCQPATRSVGVDTYPLNVVCATYDITNEKIVAFGASAGSATTGTYSLDEVKKGSDISGFTVRYMAAGRV